MKTNQLKVGALLSYFQFALNALISLIYTPIMLRLLGQNEYGIYTMSSSMISYLGLLNFGLNSSYVRFYTRYKKDEDYDGLAKLNGLFLIVYTCIAIIAFISGILLGKNIHLIYGKTLTDKELETAGILMMILAFNLAMTFVSTIFVAYITANEQFIFHKLLNMGKTVISPLLTIPLLLLGYRSVGMAVATTIVGIVVDLSNMVFCFKKLNIRFAIKGADFRVMQEVATYSVFIAINSIVDQINWQVDKVILGHFHGAKETAVYGVASQLNTLYISISTAISSVFTARVHRIVYEEDSKNKFDRLFIKIGRVQMLILGLVSSGLILFGKPFISFWAGNGYESVYGIVLLLVLPGTIALIQNVGIEIQRAKNMHQFRSWMYLGMAFINIIVSIPLGERYGGLGCAVGTAISLIFANGIVMNWFYAEKMGLEIKLFWTKIIRLLPAIIISMLLGGVLIYFVSINTIVKLGICILAYSLLYFLICWRMSMNLEEKELVKNLLRKVIRK